MTRTLRPAVVCAPSAADLAFLDRMRRVRHHRSATGLTGWCWAGVAWLRRRSAVLVRRGATLVLLLVAAAGLAVAVAPPASADLLEPNTWCDRKSFNPVRADMGLLGVIVGEQNADNGPNSPPATKWAMYGDQGTRWETFWLDCLDYRRVVNEAANQVFMLSKVFATIAILVFMWTFKGDILNIFLDSDRGVGGTGATLDDMIRQIHADVYLQLFSVAVLIAAVVLAFRFLFKRDGGSDMFGRFAAMVLVAGFAFFYGGTPGGGGPHASVVLKTVNDWTNEITSVVLSAFAGTDCENPSIRVSAGDDFTETAEARNQRRDLALQCAAEAFYEVTIYTPWAVGELGRYDVATRGTGGPTETQVLAQRILAQQAYSYADIAKNGNDPARYRDQRGDPGDDVCKATNHDDMSTYTGKLCDRARMRQTVIGADDDQFQEAEWSWSRVVADNQMYWENWSGGQAGNRFQVSLLALIGSSSISLIVVIVSLAYLVLEIATIMFALMAPLAFLIGLIPGFGMRILLRWLELLLGTFVKRVVLGLFVGLLVALYSVVLTTSMPWLMKLVLVCMIAAIGLIYRKKFAEAFALNFSGSTALHKDGDMSSGLVAGAVGGALGGRAAGGSTMSGVVGGMARRVSPNATVAYLDAMSRQVNTKPRPRRKRK